MSVDNSKTMLAETQGQVTPQGAVEMLKAGNERFVSSNQLSREYPQQVSATARGQWPYAAVLGCIDSRVPNEVVFDQGIGDIFSARVAGNFVNTDILGSLEYACGVAGSKAIVVLGHEGCGAVKAACDDVKVGNITDMLAKIKPSVEATPGDGDRSSANGEFVSNVVRTNVELTIENMRSRSEMLRDLESEGKIAIVGAVYDVASGRVSFL